MFFSKKKISHATEKLLNLAYLEKWRILLATICMGVVAISTASYAYLVGPVIKSLFLHTESAPIPLEMHNTSLLQQISEHLSHASAGWIGAMILGAALIKGVAFYFQRILVIGAGQRILFSLRAKMYRGLLQSAPIEAPLGTPGELVSRFTIDAETIEQAITKGILAIVRDGLQVAALAILAFALAPKLGIVGLIALPPIGVVISRISKSLRKKKGRVYDGFSALGHSVEETSNGLSTVQSFGIEKTAEKRFHGHSQTLMNRGIKALRVKAFSSPLNEILGAGALALTLWYAHHQIELQSLRAEEFISFFTALFLLYQPIKGLGNGFHQLAGGLAAMDRLKPLISPTSPLSSLSPSPLGPEDNPKKQLDLTISHLRAGYGDGPDIIENLSLTLHQGEKTALVGASGCGKSTLLYALLGQIKPRDGHITYPSGDFTCPPVAPIFQEPFLFDDSIKMNVLCGRPNASDEEIHSACEVAGVLPFSNELPTGLDHPIGPGGSNLSVGQRQRICIARALVSGAPVLLMDEATASLDGETEQAMVEKLAKTKKDLTMLVVTHRISTAKWCDRIVMLKDGKIAIDGTPEHVLENEEILGQLFGAQTDK